MSENVSSSNDNGVVPRLRVVQSVPPAVVIGPGGGGDGPDEPMLTPRVEALERGMDEIRDVLARIEKSQDDSRRDINALKDASSELKQSLREIQKKQIDQGEALSELKGRVGNLPTTLQLILFVIAVMAFGFGRQFFGA